MITSIIYLFPTIIITIFTIWRQFTVPKKGEVISYDYFHGYKVKIKISNKYIESNLLDKDGADGVQIFIGSIIDVYYLKGIPTICYLTKRSPHMKVIKVIIALVLGICWFAFAYINKWIL